MAFANFFDKARMSAAHVLAGFDNSLFEERLEGVVVGLAYDETVSTPEGAAALDLSIRLMARLYPRFRLIPLGGAKAPAARRLVRAINPNIEFSRVAPTHLLVLGSTAVQQSGAIYIGSDGWLARASSRGPVGFGVTANPFGAGAAACLGAANIFRQVFTSQLERGRADDDARVSLYDFRTGEEATAGPPVGVVDIGRTRLVGLGAIGNGCLWALARLREARGVLDLIDREPIELSNLQRYILTTQADVGRLKVALGAEALQKSMLTVHPFYGTWADYLSGTGDWHLERVAVALDTKEDRIAVQASLPFRVLNAWTRIGNLGVSRHSFLGERACMACLYLPEARQPNRDEIVAEALGVPERVLEVRQMLITGQPVGEEFLAAVAHAKGVAVELLREFSALPLRDLYQRAVCGGLLVRLGNDEARPQAEVPLAFQSALAGVMLAAELVIDALGAREADFPTRTTVDLTRPLVAGLSVDDGKPGVGPVQCICQDPIFQKAYRTKYAGRLGCGEAEAAGSR